MGTLGTQIAKSRGAEVTCVDRSDKFDVMRRAGADHVIDYTTDDFARNEQQYDLIIDVACTRSPFAIARALRPGGSYTIIGGNLWRAFQTFVWSPFFRCFSTKHMSILMHAPNEGLAELEALIADSTVKPIIEQRFGLSQVAEAIQHLGDGNVKGKVVVEIRLEA